MESVDGADRARSWACAASAGSVALPVAALALLLDVAVSGRPLLQAQLEHRWWGHLQEMGCWMAARRCAGAQGRHSGAEGGAAPLLIWKEGDDALNEQQCMAAASRHWRECLDPSGKGLIAATFRPGGRSAVYPEFLEAEPELRARLSVTLRASSQLLVPWHTPWELELCGTGEGCQRVSVASFCDSDALVGAELDLGWPLSLCAACGAVAGGRVPVACAAAVDNSPCMPDRCSSLDRPALAGSCDKFCGLAVHAHWVFGLGIAAAGCALFGSVAALQWGWRRHGGCAAALSAMVGAVAAPISLSLIATGDAATALALAAATLLLPGTEGVASVVWAPRLGLAEVVLASLALVATGFYSIGAQKSWMAATVRYGPLEDRPRSWFPAVGGFLGPRPVPVARGWVHEDPEPEQSAEAEEREGSGDDGTAEPHEFPARWAVAADDREAERSAQPRVWGVPLPSALRRGRGPKPAVADLNCDSLFPSHTAAAASATPGAGGLVDLLDDQDWAAVDVGPSAEADLDASRSAGSGGAQAGGRQDPGAASGSPADARHGQPAAAWGSPAHQGSRPIDSNDPVQAFSDEEWAFEDGSPLAHAAAGGQSSASSSTSRPQSRAAPMTAWADFSAGSGVVPGR